MNVPLTMKTPDVRLQGIIKLAILAVGGQGGGVLTNWIEDLARRNGYAAQATSVAGVAQRTGATVYYIEMAPAEGGTPIFSLAPAGGEQCTPLSLSYKHEKRQQRRAAAAAALCP